MALLLRLLQCLEPGPLLGLLICLPRWPCSMSLLWLAPGSSRLLLTRIIMLLIRRSIATWKPDVVHCCRPLQPQRLPQ